uniref:Uncharacterized protein n=1 Tax=Utricularia reniformis TaxID=192314 RepID=A0A1Y0B3R4_9LAMI|nr:hypothetical protein AEK19_MT1797 [Utricularia reniformis]ART31969.1 hypothetical protein AEK19_MT1797 [Utricularia reniformis]
MQAMLSATLPSNPYPNSSPLSKFSFGQGAMLIAFIPFFNSHM